MAMGLTSVIGNQNHCIILVLASQPYNDFDYPITLVSPSADRRMPTLGLHSVVAHFCRTVRPDNKSHCIRGVDHMDLHHGVVGTHTHTVCYNRMQPLENVH